MSNKDILDVIQDNYNEKKLDEKQKQDVLYSTRDITIIAIVILAITTIINFIFKNSQAIAENIGIFLTLVGISNYILDKKLNKKIILDIVLIALGIFFYIGYIGMLMGK